MKKKLIKIIAMALATVCAVVTLGACDGAFSTIDGWLDNVFGEAPVPDLPSSDTSGSDGTDSTNSGTSGSNSTDSGTPDSGTSDSEATWVDITGNIAGGVSGYFADGVLTPLSVPENESALTTTGIAYLGAELNLLDKTQMKFRVNVTQEVLDMVNSSVYISLGAIIAPLGTLESFNADQYTVIDWGNEMLGAGYTYGFDKAPGVGVNYITMTDMRVENYNSAYVCIPFIQTTEDRAPTFKYADMSADGKTYRDHACSMAYLASAHLNTHAKNNMLMEAQENLCKEIVGGATDQLTGTNLSNEIAFPTISTDVFVTIKKGATGKLRVSFTPYVKLETLFTCSDTNVATVDEYTGEVTAKATGEAMITLLVGGRVYSVKLKVTE